MNRIVLVLAFFAFTFASPKVSSMTQGKTLAASCSGEETREKISPEDLPKKVVETILESEETNGRVVSEVYKVTQSDQTVYYEVKFGTEAQAMVKKYDKEGEEIKEQQEQLSY
ncbi:hypothetical protein [Echinicola vietnamensis]|uniref:Uncharacterized protein n=1 Tax=Echinicola vietnamensis (strain DSM 17526 / LMG 23754 / KMM 6221) TaxID=926556 RepID=L0FX80_ECHVK|nr:hypothetical protein [Echinicola vietnamensis]AGA77260.1 hypothetical protein Echvi_0989 [Echinicola vietnamensis DSM 17526]